MASVVQPSVRCSWSHCSVWSFQARAHIHLIDREASNVVLGEEPKDENIVGAEENGEAIVRASGDPADVVGLDEARDDVREVSEQSVDKDSELELWETAKEMAESRCAVPAVPRGGRAMNEAKVLRQCLDGCIGIDIDRDEGSNVLVDSALEEEDVVQEILTYKHMGLGCRLELSLACTHDHVHKKMNPRN
ncbi:Aste57867_17941 [Aphanomyces stellatus]|uniref:Aste57867_17941 protein n=1 Tax=Aphanomyces stellatus TaxID=120398 RepID=A0A485L919_9STRA|nr:hypothetical protein As57867_017879 [Aphanomyces stellatus]VFT94682.1 Aste57867_17941 [Aphanomyces stellatus]